MKAKKKSKAKAKSRKVKKPAAASAYWATARSPGKSSKARAEALSRLPASLCEDRTKFNEILALLRDASQPSALRHATLRSLQAASFSSPGWDKCRPDYLSTLRSLVEDPDLALRRRALGLLARANDGSTQQLLMAGLKNPARAVVPPEKALQLLGYDIHTDAYEVAREIVARPPSEAARIEALRMLGADANSTPLFEQVLTDKKESPEARRVAASALQALAPEKLQGHARDIVQDESDDDDVKATSLTAITELGQPAAVTDSLYQSVDRLRSRSKSSALKKGARRFITKYRR